VLNFLDAVLGGALLLFGRKLFWLFVGVIGFLIGAQIAARFIRGPELLTIGAGLLLGIIFAVLAIFVQTLAIGVAGFLGGGYILLSLGALLGLDRGLSGGILFIIGGAIGVALIVWLFDWALISISALTGSSMIVDAFRLGRGAAALIFLILLLIGVAVQGAALNAEKREPRRSA